MKLSSRAILLLGALAAINQARAFGDSGGLLWAKQAGGSLSDRAFGVVSLADGTAYVTGLFGGTATLGEGEPNETVFTTLGGSDIFLAHYASDGALLWVRRDGGTGNDASVAVAAYDDDSAVICGTFSASATFGAGEPNETTLSPAGPSDIFIAKYDAAGTLLWAKRAGGTGFHEARDVDALPDGGAVLTGYFRDTSTFGPGETNETVLTGTSGNGFFAARYGADGTLTWAKQAVGGISNAGLGICGLADGSALVTGIFSGSVTFGLGETNETIFSGSGSGQFVLAKYASDGSLVWAKRGVGSGSDAGLDVMPLTGGAALVSGHIGFPSGGSTTFGSGEPNETLVSSSGSMRAFFARFESDGALTWIRTMPSSVESSARRIDPSNDGGAVVTGFFSGSTTFGPGEPNQTVLSSAGGRDIFVAKYDPTGALVSAWSAGGPADDFGDGISLDPNGDAFVSGRFAAAATFGLGEINQTTLTSAGDRDAVIAKYTFTPLIVGAPATDASGLVIVGSMLLVIGVIARCRWRTQ